MYSLKFSGTYQLFYVARFRYEMFPSEHSLSEDHALNGLPQLSKLINALLEKKIKRIGEREVRFLEDDYWFLIFLANSSHTMRLWRTSISLTNRECCRGFACNYGCGAISVGWSVVWWVGGYRKMRWVGDFPEWKYVGKHQSGINQIIRIRT